MEEQRDLVVFSDDEGNEFELEIVDYFDYEGQEYAVLVDPESGCGCGCGSWPAAATSKSRSARGCVRTPA